MVYIPGPSLEGLGSIPGKGNFLPVSSSLLLHRSSLFWCCFDTFSLMGHIQTKDRLHMGNDTLRHLAMMYVNKPTTDDPDGESD